MKQFWLINLGLFQACWLSAAFFTQYAALIIAALLILHFYLSPSPKLDAKLMLLAFIGISADSLHIYLGIFSAKGAFFPLWLALLWIMFSISLNHSLRWFTQATYGLLALAGSLGGTLSYWGGIQTGALFTEQTSGLVITVLALSWGLLFPLLIIGYRFLFSHRLSDKNKSY